MTFFAVRLRIGHALIQYLLFCDWPDAALGDELAAEEAPAEEADTIDLLDDGTPVVDLELSALQDLESAASSGSSEDESPATPPVLRGWGCKNSKCRKKCNRKNKNGNCIGPVCVCWS